MIKGIRWRMTLVVAFSLIFVSLNAAFCSELTPSEVVLKYYHALQKKDFATALQCVSKGMRQDKSDEEWLSSMKVFIEGGDVVIMKVSATPGPISDKEAQVSSVITSKDAFNPEGVTEHNIEYLVLEEGIWKLDRTEVGE
ncbi:MAG: hypothetical protein RBT11_12060 [Desulfobacterales bacterium]|nr:hypothetical protein [Desulfobacterales bacterium]